MVGVALLGGCGDAASATTGAADPCAAAGAACGELARCDPVDARCYCDPGAMGDPQAGCVAHGDLCGEAAARVDKRVCVHELDDPLTWDAISIGYSKRKDVRKLGKYLVPARPGARLPTLFNEANAYRLHFCMLSEGFEPLFPGFTHAGYNDLVYYREAREMFAGNIYEFSGEGPERRFGFTVETPDDADELLGEAEVYGIYRHLQDRLTLGEIGYVPNSEAQQAAADAWVDPRVPIAAGGDETISYEAYSTGTAYGRVRRYTSAELAGAAGSFGWQDILVLESAPSDLSGVMAGVITGARQDVLSHLNVLAARRGTPNVYVASPLTAFASFDGELVRLAVSDLIYSIEKVSLAEAEQFWAAQRPSVAVEHLPDPDFEATLDVLSIATATAEARGLAVGRFGGKVTGLATLYATLDPSYQTPAFGVPTAHYLRFMQDNSWTLTVAGSQQTLSYADTIAAWLADPTFRSDTAVRRAWLHALAAEMVQRGKVDPALLDDLRARVAAVFGDDAAMVRLRSSSNAEDGLEFNGAGLYRSESGCAVDPDGSSGGASACDPDKGRRPLDRALKLVWASLWDFGAFEEREYYQIDHRDVGMGVLVSTRYEDERANGVAFTGDPIDAEDGRYTINVQLGEVDVVSPPAGTTAELDRVTIVNGEVVAIDRVAPSSLVEPGEVVLDDAQLEELGAVLAGIAGTYPVEPGEHAPEDVLLDLEFKIDAQGKLVIKQIRPFLRGASDPSLPTCL
jgi:pyruvate,water dikinase